MYPIIWINQERAPGLTVLSQGPVYLAGFPLLCRERPLGPRLDMFAQQDISIFPGVF
jgi:hypothetical protein